MKARQRRSLPSFPQDRRPRPLPCCCASLRRFPPPRTSGSGPSGRSRRLRCSPVIWARWCRQTSSRSEEHTSELQSRLHLVCRLLLEKKNTGEAAGTATIWVRGESTESDPEPRPSLIVRDLAELVDLLVAARTTAIRRRTRPELAATG